MAILRTRLSRLCAMAAATFGLCAVLSARAASPAELSGISGLALWLDANDFSGYATGTQISSWTDKAGNLSFAPMNNSYKPTVDNDGPRGNTVVHFVRPNSGNLKQTQALRCQNNAIKSWSQVTHTSFAVARSTLTGGNAGKENSSYVYALPGNHSGLEFWANGSNDLIAPTEAGLIRWTADSSGGGANGTLGVRGAYTAGDYVMISAVVRGAAYNTKGVSMDVFLDNGLVDTAANANKYLFKQNPENDMRIGGSNNGNDYSGGLNGDIAEILVFNRELSAEEQATVWNYLGKRWGLISFTIANPVTGSPDAISSPSVAISSVPVLEEGTEWQISMESAVSDLDPTAWASASTPAPATFSFPAPAADGDVTIYFWTRESGDDSTATGTAATIAYTTVAPTAAAQDIAIEIDSVAGTAVTPAMIDDGSTDAIGIYSMSVEPSVVHGPTTVTLTVVNMAGVSATATAQVGVSQYSDFHVAADGNDGTGDGSASAPFATITHALEVANAAAESAGTARTVYVGPGTFSAETGETLPLVVSNNVSLVGSGMGGTIVDGSRTYMILTIAASTADATVRGLSLRRSNRCALNMEAYNGTVADCEISDISGAIWNAIYINSTGTRNTTLDGLVVTNIHVTGSPSTRQIFDLRGAGGTLTVRDCLFKDISTTVAAGQHNGNFRIMHPTSVQTQGWNSRFEGCTFEDITAPGGNNGEGCCIMFGKTANNGSHVIDRCVFRNIGFTNNGEALLGGDNANASGQRFQVSNCLFAGIHFKNNGSGYTSSCVGGFRVYPVIYNCTFHDCDTVVRPSASATLQMFNCSVSDCGHLALGNSPGTYVYLKNVNIHNTPDAVADANYSAANSANVTSYDPYYKNAGGGNFKLKPLSPLVDAGDNAYAQGGLDLAGGVRIADGNDDDVSTIDIGAYEYDPDGAGARFVAGAATYGAFAGRSVTIPVWIEPAEERGPVTATVSYPTNTTGSASLYFATGLETNLLVVSVADPLDIDSGTLLELDISDADEELDSASIGLLVNNREVTVPGYASRIFLRAGETASLPIQLPDAVFAAPEAISIAASAQTGAGGSAIDWEGSGIAQGAYAADGTLEIGCSGAGSDTLTLTLPSGWTFAESGENTLAVETIGFASPLYVSPEGSDASGLGTEESPLRTMTYAVPLLAAGETLRLLPGTYGQASGENFPVTVPPGIALEGERGPLGTAADAAIVDPGASARAFTLGTLGADPGTIAGGALRSLVIRNSAGTAIYGRYWGGEIEDCAILKSVGGGFIGNCAVLYINPSRGNVVLSGTEIGCVTSAVPEFVYVESGNGSFTVTNCWFHGLRGTGATRWAYTGGMLNSRVPLTVVDSLFEDIELPPNGSDESYGVCHSYNTQVAYLRNCFRRIEIVSDHPHFSVVSVNRCGSALVADCLFHDITCAGAGAVLGGFNAVYTVANCTLDAIPTLFHSHENTATARIVDNSTVSRCDTLNRAASGTTLVTLRNSNLFDIANEGTGYNTNASANVTAFDPLFKDAANGDYRLGNGSPLINAGDNALVTAAMGETDLEGNARVFRADNGGAVDIGCYEYSVAGGTLFLLR